MLARMVLDCLLIAAGFALLGKGASLFVDGASSLAKRFNVTDLVIGLTVVALGTSAPELVVSVLSSAAGNSGIALGNVLGSNIANICVVLGVAGLVRPISIRRGVFWREIPICLGAGVLLLALVIPTGSPYVIIRSEGILLLLGLAGYLIYMFRTAVSPRPTAVRVEQRRLGVAVVMTVLGLGGLVLGGELIVRAAVRIAEELGVSQEMIGLTIVALGTSLPELATTLFAILRGKADMAIGNVVGSNIINTGLVLGTAATIRPLAVEQQVLSDAMIAVVAALMLFLAMFTGKRQRLDRWEAAILLLLYVGYIAFTVWRG